MLRRKLLILALTGVGLLLMVSLVACTGAKSPSGQPTAQPSVQSSPRSTPAGPAPGKPGPLGQPVPANTPQAAPLNTVTGDGTLAIVTYANLYFGSAGQIEKINVKAGDRASKGMVLASLDTTSLEASLAQAKVNLDQAQLVQAQSQVALDQAQLTKVQAQIALNQAQLSQIQAESALTTAQYNLDKVQAVSDIKDVITKLQQQITTTQVNLTQAIAVKDTGSADAMRQNLVVYQQQLQSQQKALATLLNGAEYSGANALTYDIMGQTYDRLTVEDARMKELAVEAAQKVVDNSENGIALAQKTLDKSDDGIALAQKTLDKSNDGIALAQQNTNLLQEQLILATITAPFDGVVAVVNQNVNDFVAAPAQSQRPIFYLVDTTTMQLNIGVNELDMPKVKLGQKAKISVDAFPDVKLDGKVSNILLLPTVQGGIVDYTVTVSFSVPPTANVMIGMNATAAITIE